MPKHSDIKRVMVIGSGPIIIGQAAEFDYAGAQACKSLREEGVEVILVNSNPATIMTDLDIADIVYIEPLTVEFLQDIIRKERPDGLLPTLGGQTGLNLAVELAHSGVLDECGVRLLGTTLESIEMAEDREKFRDLMNEINQPILESEVIETVEEGMAFAKQIGLPLIIRPAYTLGGTGGGVVRNEKDLREMLVKGLKLSRIHQVLLEKCITGWREIEYEVMRDGANNCFIVCNMENIDPMGVHTGDSIVIAPSQTLTDKEYQMLRTGSLDIIRALKIEGGCNVQYSLDLHSMQYYVIEVNPRVSRSSALASKATGYPIAKVAAKIAIGLTLDEIVNPVTRKTYASFEPALDYVVTKIPRWPFDKFAYADRSLGSQMKATGEVMAIGRSLENSLLKAVRSLEIGVDGPRSKDLDLASEMQIESRLENPCDDRLFAIFEGFRRGMVVSEIAQLTNMDPFFLDKMRKIILFEEEIVKRGWEGLDPKFFRQAKEMGFADQYIARLIGKPLAEVEKLREKQGLWPVYKMVDTCAGEFEAETPYYYSSWEAVSEVRSSDRKKVVVIGSGPIRIGQGIEFDYCCVHCIFALRELGMDAIIINNNPETVSTDFDTADRLYFEPLLKEDVLNIIHEEKADGVVVQFGGQTAINLAGPLHKAGIRIFGSDFESIDVAEDRDRFENLLNKLDISRPKGNAVTTLDEAKKTVERVGFPVVVRPSYVLGGRAMEIVYDYEDLEKYFADAGKATPDHPILVDKYMEGKEVEVDLIGDGEDYLIPGIMEHIERAGVHSGDSMAVYPTQNISREALDKIVDYSGRMAKALNVRGLMNIQYVVVDDDVHVIEVNPRASRTVPWLSKITGIPMVKIATQIFFGATLKKLGMPTGLLPPARHVAVKSPVFSFAKLLDVDINLGPEMKSTGEIMGIDYEYSFAVYKAMVAAGLHIEKEGKIMATIADRDKEEAVPILKGFVELGYQVIATAGTAAMLHDNGIKAEVVFKLGEGNPNILDLVHESEIVLLINTLSKDKVAEADGAKIRRASVEYSIPCLTSLDTARALLFAMQGVRRGDKSFACLPMNDYEADVKNQLLARDS